MPSPILTRLFFSSSTADGNTIHIQHDVGPPLLVPLERHLLGDSEIVFLWLLPIYEVDGFRHLARLGLHRHAVAQQVVDGVVVAVKRAAVVVRFGAESVESRTDLRRRVTARLVSHAESRPSSMLLLPSRSVQSPT